MSDQSNNIPGKVLDSKLKVKATGKIKDITDGEKSVADPTPEEARAMLEGSDDDVNTHKFAGKDRGNK